MGWLWNTRTHTRIPKKFGAMGKKKFGKKKFGILAHTHAFQIFLALWGKKIWKKKFGILAYTVLVCENTGSTCFWIHRFFLCAYRALLRETLPDNSNARIADVGALEQCKPRFRLGVD